MGFDFEQIIAGAPPRVVFALIEKWLKNEGAKIEQRKPPVYLEAVHGKRLHKLDERDARKRLEFKLQGTASSTRIATRVVPLSYDAAEMEPHKAVAANLAYRELLGELWRELSGGGNSTGARRG